MAIAITRTAWTDDDGSGTTGTVINNAAKTSLYDQIDAVLNATRAADLLFTDATYDIGKTGATRPRDIFASRNGVFGGTLTVADYLGSNGAGGLSIAAVHASGAIRFYSGGTTLRGSWDTSGNLIVSSGTIYSYNAAPMIFSGIGSAAGTALVSDGGGAMKLTTSSRRYKEHFSPFVVSDATLAAFVSLRPQNWDYRGQQTGAVSFISEDLDTLGVVNAYGASPLINYDAQGRPESNRDYAIIGLQHLVLQSHDARIAALEAELAALKAAWEQE